MRCSGAVEAAAGRRVARAAWEEAQRGAREFAAALKKLPIKCDLSRRVAGHQRAHRR